MVRLDVMFDATKFLDKLASEGVYLVLNDGFLYAAGVNETAFQLVQGDIAKHKEEIAFLLMHEQGLDNLGATH